jgi:hypothetical protein
MRWIQFLPSGEAVLHRHRNPMAEIQMLYERWGQPDGPSRDMVKEECSAWLQRTNACPQEPRDVSEVLGLNQAIGARTTAPIELPEIERRIQKNDVCDFGLQRTDDLKGVTLNKIHAADTRH